MNNTTAGKVVKKLLSLSLPQKTEIIDKISIAGKLTGNGNGMQYFGGILIKSDLSFEELEDYYSKFKNQHPNLEVRPQQSNEIEIIEHGDYYFKEWTDTGNIYIVYNWGSSNEFLETFDIRGH